MASIFFCLVQMYPCYIPFLDMGLCVFISNHDTKLHDYALEAYIALLVQGVLLVDYVQEFFFAANMLKWYSQRFLAAGSCVHFDCGIQNIEQRIRVCERELVRL